MADRILIPFEGEGSGVEELTWGQHMVWEAILACGSSMHMSGVTQLAEGATLEEVVAKWRFVMSRYQAIRTRLRLGADGRALQAVASSGEIPLEIVDAGDGDPAEVAEAVRARYEATNFDYVNEWPVRLAVVRQHGSPTHDVATLCHLVTDGVGALVLLADVAARDPVTGQAKAPVARMVPLELARWQRTPAMRRQSDVALRYWEGLLRTIPPRRFRDSTDTRELPCWRAAYNSPATYKAVRLVAARSNADFASALLAVVAVTLAQVTGSNPVVTQLLVSNRFRPGLADMVGQVAMWGLCAVDVADATLDEALGRAWRSAMRAYKNAYYDQRQLGELLARVGRERGGDIDLSCFFNDRRMLGAEDAVRPVPTEEEVLAALPRSALRWLQPWDTAVNKLFISVNPVPDTVDLEMWADTHYVSPADLEALLRGVEAVAVSAALDPATPTGIRSRPAPVSA